MHRIDTSTAQVDKFGAGKNGFTGGNPQTGELPTALDADFFDSLQEEVSTVIEGAGVALDKSKNNQLLAALNLLFKQPVNYPGIVGQSRNARMTVAAASSIGDFLADELIVNSALGGNQYRLKSVSARITLTTIGAGGMATGSVPATGYVAVYVIYNPTSGSVALLGMDATSVLAPEVYGGANMPAGYTASSLVAVWPTASSQFVIGNLIGRKIEIATRTLLSSSTVNANRVSLTTTQFPLNAKSIYGNMSVGSTTASSCSVVVWGANSQVGGMPFSQTVVAGGAYAATFSSVSVTNQTIGWSSGNTAGTPTFAIGMGAYEF
jgi:hypothetical protein